MTKTGKLAPSKFDNDRLMVTSGREYENALLAIFLVDTRHLAAFPEERIESGLTSVPDDGLELSHKSGASGDALVVHGDIGGLGGQKSIIRLISLVRQPADQLSKFPGVRWSGCQCGFGVSVHIGVGVGRSKARIQLATPHTPVKVKEERAAAIP